MRPEDRDVLAALEEAEQAAEVQRKRETERGMHPGRTQSAVRRELLVPELRAALRRRGLVITESGPPAFLSQALNEGGGVYRP